MEYKESLSPTSEALMYIGRCLVPLVSRIRLGSAMVALNSKWRIKIPVAWL